MATNFVTVDDNSFALPGPVQARIDAVIDQKVEAAVPTVDTLDGVGAVGLAVAKASTKAAARSEIDAAALADIPDADTLDGAGQTGTAVLKASTPQAAREAIGAVSGQYVADAISAFGSNGLSLSPDYPGLYTIPTSTGLTESLSHARLYTGV